MADGRPLTETPTWAVATVVSIMVTSVILFTKSFEFFGHWLDKRKRKPLVAALNKIKEELMVFGLLSLLMGHWSIFVAKICIRSSAFSTRFIPCIPETIPNRTLVPVQHIIISNSSKDVHHRRLQDHVSRHAGHRYCAKGYESFASYESLEQLHRLLFVLGVTHVIYSSLAIALAIIKIYSWRIWEDEAKAMESKVTQDCPKRLNRLCSFVVHHTSHPWSQHKVLVWLLIDVLNSLKSRQFWSSINIFDYLALRFGFITTHELPLSYDFLNYMVRSMAEEFQDIVGISLPLWIFAIFCIFLDFHGTNIYFWISFLPAIIIILIGTKLHRIVAKIAVDILDSQSSVGAQDFKLRDGLFWFGKPRLLLRFIQFISFQNALEMAKFIWSVWEINGTSCFMKNPNFIVIRLTFGLVTQVWCSFVTFPLYVIIAQMGSKFKRTVLSEGVRKSLHGWKKRVKSRQNSNSNDVRLLNSVTSMPLMHDVERYVPHSSRSNSTASTSSNTSSGRRISLGNEGSRRRFPMIDYGDGGVDFTPQQSKNVEEGRIRETYDSDTCSDESYKDEYDR